MSVPTQPPDGNPIVIEDESLAPGFTQIPNAILRRSDISPGAKVAYIVLLSYAWGKDACYPGQSRMAKDCGVTDRSVRNYLRELIERELVSIVRRGHTKTNVYIIRKISPEKSSGLTQDVSTLSETSSGHDVSFLSAHERKIFPIKNTQYQEDPKKEYKERYAPPPDIKMTMDPQSVSAMLRAGLGRK